MTRVKSLFIIVGGLVIFVLGFGMWRSPEINWDGFIGSFAVIGEEFVRLKGDPFAILGILIIVVGVFITYQGIKRLVKRAE
jgi:hypothetical protein